AGRDGGSTFDATDAIASVWGESIRSGDADAGSAGDFCAGAWGVVRSGAAGGIDRSDAGAPGGLAPSTSLRAGWRARLRRNYGRELWWSSRWSGWRESTEVHNALSRSLSFDVAGSCRFRNR